MKLLKVGEKYQKNGEEKVAFKAIGEIFTGELQSETSQSVDARGRITTRTMTSETQADGSVKRTETTTVRSAGGYVTTTERTFENGVLQVEMVTRTWTRRQNMSTEGTERNTRNSITCQGS